MPAKPQFDAQQYLDEHHQRISEFGAEYFDDEEEREEFINTLLERRGYQRTAGWAAPPPQDPNQGRAPGNAGAGAPPARPRPTYFRR